MPVSNQIGTTNIIKHHNINSSQPTTNNNSSYNNNRNKDNNNSMRIHNNNPNSNTSSPTLPVQVLSVFRKPRVEQKKKLKTKRKITTKTTTKKSKKKLKKKSNRKNLTANRFLSLPRLLLQLSAVSVCVKCAMCVFNVASKNTLYILFIYYQRSRQSMFTGI